MSHLLQGIIESYRKTDEYKTTRQEWIDRQSPESVIGSLVGRSEVEAQIILNIMFENTSMFVIRLMTYAGSEILRVMGEVEERESEEMGS
jgi:hypothetical protein